jgi:thiamine-monophosphate kinase
LSAATAGDDYEIAFTAPSARRDEVLQAARRVGTAVTEIGRVEAGSGVALLDSSGREIPVSRKGYRHF